MLFRSPFPDVEIPDAAVHDFVRATADKMGDKAALIDATTGTTVTFAEMASSIRALAGAFAARGLQQGGVIGLYSTNSIAYPVVFHAATRAGLTITTLNALYTPKDIALQLKDA